MRHIVICGLSRSTVFFQIYHKWHDFRKKKVLNTKCIFEYLYKVYLKNFSFQEEMSKM
jgi:hypothetical protein